MLSAMVDALQARYRAQSERQPMFNTPFALRRWNEASIALGLAAWMAMILAREIGRSRLSDPSLLLLLMFWVIAPLAISLMPPPGKGAWKLFHLAILLQPFAALCGFVSLLLAPGAFAGVVAGIWLLFSLLLALLGLLFLFQTRARSLPESCLAGALVYLPIGALWLLMSRLNLRPLGFDSLIVLLTAVHFHFITLTALTITGLSGQALKAERRAFPHRLYRVLAPGMLITPLIVAGGITLTQVTGVRLLEGVGACLLACCLIGIALLNVCFIVPGTRPALARILLLVSSNGVVLTMLLATAYALGETTGAWTITIAQMIALHGWINGLVFGLCGLLGWRLRQSEWEKE